MEEYYDDSDFICNACQVELATPQERVSHYRGEWHRYNVKRRCAELPPIPEAFFMEKFNQVRKAKMEAESNEQKVWTCEISKRTFRTEGAYKHYLNSKEYRKAIEKQARKLNMAETPIDNNVSEDNDDETSAVQRKAPRPDDLPIQPLYSLFSSQGPFADIKSLLNHMLRTHGFFIPFVDYLVDIEGLLEYLGYKIGVGHACIFCHKMFEDCYAAQQHMRDKGHCMMTMQDETGQEDLNLLDFYEFGHNLDYDAMDAAADAEEDEDFEVEVEEDEEELVDENDDAEKDIVAPKLTREQRQKLREQQRFRTMQLLGLQAEVISEENGEPMSAALTVPVERKRQLKDMNEFGELILSDGTVLGNRAHIRAYNKRERDPSVTNIVRSELMAKYYALKMPGYVSQEQQKITNRQNHMAHQSNLRRHFGAGIQQNMILRKHFRSSNTL